MTANPNITRVCRTSVFLSLMMFVAYGMGAAPEASADVVAYSDGWTNDEEQNEWEGAYDTEVYVAGIAEDTFGAFVSVDTAFWNPSGDFIAAQSGNGSGFGRADLNSAVAIESEVDGEYLVDSSHYQNWNYWGYTWLILGRNSIRTRYQFNQRLEDIHPNFQTCTVRFQYLSVLCFGRCQFSGFHTNAMPGIYNTNLSPPQCVPLDVNWVNPPAYMEGSGDKWRVLFIEWCRIRYRGRQFFPPICRAG